MGYLIGGQPTLVTRNLEANFRLAKTAGQVVSPGGTVTDVPDLLPQKGPGMNRKVSGLYKVGAPGGLDVTRVAPMFNDPRYTSSTLAIPTDERTLHGLYRFFRETDPIVGAAIKLHTELPLAGVSLGTCEDRAIQAHYEEMWNRIQGHKTLLDMTAEYFTIGEVALFGAWNDKEYMWEQFAVLNPDYVKKEAIWVTANPLVKLVPDEALKRVVRTQSPRALWDQLPEEIIQQVLLGQEIPLDPRYVFCLSHDKAPYEVRGKSIIKRVLKTLMYEDRLQQAQFAIATRHVVPLTVVKVGDPATGWIPRQGEIDAVRDMFAAWETDPNFTVFYHWGINVDFYGSTGKVLLLGPEFDRVYKLKFIGLGVAEALITGGGATYASVRGDHQTLIKGPLGPETETFEGLWAKFTKVPTIQRLEYEYKDLHGFGFETCGVDAQGNKVWVPITKLIRHKTPNPLVHVDTGTAHIFSTDNHGYMWINPQTLVYEPVAPKEFRSREKVSLVDMFSPPECRQRYLTLYGKLLNADTAYLYGVWVTDGCLMNKHTRDAITVTTTEKAITSRVQQIGDRYFKRCRIRSGPRCGRATEVWLWDKEFRSGLCQLHGIPVTALRIPKTGKERIPPEILFHQDPVVVGGFLAGVLDGDGSLWSAQVTVLSASQRFITELSLLLRLWGIHHTCRLGAIDYHWDGGKRKPSDPTTWMYSVTLSDTTGIHRLGDLVLPFLCHPKKKARLQALMARTLTFPYAQLRDKYIVDAVDPDVFITKCGVQRGQWTMLQPSQVGVVQAPELFKFDTVAVRSVTDTDEKDVYVYDLELEAEPHTYLVGGIGWLLNHNTAYAQFEVMRQRYLSYQLKMEDLIHSGWFKPVADQAGFYRTNRPIVGGWYQGKAYGSVDDVRKDYLERFAATTLRDIQDNAEFQLMLARKEVEWIRKIAREGRQYIYPEVDWGEMAMAADQSMKNWLLQLKNKFEWLVSEETLAKVSKLDAHKEEQKYIADKKRAFERNKILQGLTGTPLSAPSVGSTVPTSIGEVPPPSPPPPSPPKAPVGKEPGTLPAMEEKPPTPPTVGASLETEVLTTVGGDYERLTAENETLLRQKGLTDEQIRRVVFGDNSIS